MISIRKYLEGGAADDAAQTKLALVKGSDSEIPAKHWVQAYRGALDAFVQAGSEACPAVTPQLSSALADVYEQIGPETRDVGPADERVRCEVRAWGRRAAAHIRQQAGDLKQMLLALAHTAQTVSARDQRCAREMETLTFNLRAAASLDDLAQIRFSIEQSAREIKRSIDRMAEEGRAALDGMQAKIADFQTRLQQAEQAASVDALTHLRTRVWMEAQLEQRVAQSSRFCIALLDLDGFKIVNDRYGHLAGDELLRQFASELRASCRSSDLVGRWGGDEFLVVLDGALSDALSQLERVRNWVCGTYELSRPRVKLQVDASAGIAEFTPPETLEHLLERADKAMYAHKASRP